MVPSWKFCENNSRTSKNMLFCKKIKITPFKKTQCFWQNFHRLILKPGWSKHFVCFKSSFDLTHFYLTPLKITYSFITFKKPFSFQNNNIVWLTYWLGIGMTNQLLTNCIQKGSIVPLQIQFFVQYEAPSQWLPFRHIRSIHFHWAVSDTLLFLGKLW